MSDAAPSSSAAAAHAAAGDEKFAQAKALRKADPERSVSLFGEALELRIKAYGDMSIKSASAYLEVSAHPPPPAPTAVRRPPGPPATPIRRASRR